MLPSKRLTQSSPLIGASCPFCHEKFVPGDRVVQCPKCNTYHHVGCWQNNGNVCAVFGCADSSADDGSVSLSTMAKEKVTPTVLAPPPSQPHRRWLVAGIVVAVLLCTITVGFFLLRDTSQPDVPHPTVGVLTVESDWPGGGNETGSTSTTATREKAAQPVSTVQPTSTNPVRSSPTKPPTKEKPTPTPPTPTVSPDSQIEHDVLDVIKRYEVIRIRSHGPSHDVSGLDTVLANGSLKSHLKAVKWQRENNAYYLITVHKERVEEISVSSPTEVEVLITKLESREFYINDKLGPNHTMYNDHYQVRYHLKRINGAWFIVDREVITSKG